ncbi:MAG TPA: hypothetical protein VGX91_09900 [Candidatus Cybelea sp.]|jgi:hypothetical protein|nr:hypothetical protein [Candidatus Cybelea sp.]
MRPPADESAILIMANLFQCTSCASYFVAEDCDLIARRSGRCAVCAKREFLKRIGLSPDFLDGLGGSQPQQ